MAGEAITAPWRCAEALIHRRTTALFAAKQFSELRDALFMSGNEAPGDLSEGKVNLLTQQQETTLEVGEAIVENKRLTDQLAQRGTLVEALNHRVEGVVDYQRTDGCRGREANS